MFDSIKDLFIDSGSDKQSFHRYGFMYDLLFSRAYALKGEPLNVMEIGVSKFEKGSLFAFCRSEMVGSFVGIDINDFQEVLPAKAEFYKLDAYCHESVNTLLEATEGMKFDVIIDDGDHRYTSQKFFLENYVDLLADNGLLVCEDVMSVELIRECYGDSHIFMFDGWMNRGTRINKIENRNVHNHDERMIIKSKSYPLTDYKTHEYKEHIRNLPVTAFPEYDYTSKELAVTVPLFHSDNDTNYRPFDVKRFQEIHVKGAIWAVMSFVHNSDLADNGVPAYFHVEDKVWDAAKAVFDEFQVPSRCIKRMRAPLKERTSDPDVTRALFGKMYLPLTDESIDVDTLLIMNSDFFTCSSGEKLKLYDKLTSPLLKSEPGFTYFYKKKVPYWWYVGIICLAAGLPQETIYTKQINHLERHVYEKLGFKKALEKTDQFHHGVERYVSENYVMTFPREHPARDFAIKNIMSCHATPYIFSPWAESNKPLLELSKIMGYPMFDWEEDYIKSLGEDNRTGAFIHVRVKEGQSKMTVPSRCREYLADFLSDVARYVEEDRSANVASEMPIASSADEPESDSH